MKQPPWEISVWRKDVNVEAFQVPFHKLGCREVEYFLKALVVRLRTKSLEDMISYYVNSRRDHPTRLPFADVVRYEDSGLTKHGYWCGEWECYAIATQVITEDHRAIIDMLRMQAMKRPQ